MLNKMYDQISEIVKQFILHKNIAYDYYKLVNTQDLYISKIKFTSFLAFLVLQCAENLILYLPMKI